MVDSKSRLETEILARFAKVDGRAVVVVRKRLMDEGHKAVARFCLTRSGEWVEVSKVDPCPEECYLDVEEAEVIDA